MQKISSFLSLLLLIGFVFVSFFVFKLQKDVEYLDMKISGLSKGSAVNTLTEAKTDKESVAADKMTGDLVSYSQMEKYVDDYFLKYATKTATPGPSVPAVVSSPVVAKKNQTSYVSMGTSFSTTSTSWVEVPDSGVYIDLANDYSSEAYVTWDASVKVMHGNGTSYVRIWDDTNKIAVSSSELSSSNNADFKQVYSPQLALWKGRNLYKVQVKSLNGYEVTYSGGRMKFVY